MIEGLNCIRRILPYGFKKGLRRGIGRINSFGKPKIFCVGRNKTGTTSLKKALEDWGYVIGSQGEAEHLIDHYKKRNFRAVAHYCKAYQAFQDAPFSWPFTFISMDQFFPGSKFILTIRNSPEQWYNSIVKFHAKMFGDGKKANTEDLKEATYREKGWIWNANQTVYNAPESEPYKKKVLINSYIDHNELVKEYFRMRGEDLLVINPADNDSYGKLASFLNKNPLYNTMPWENKTH